MFIPTNKTGKLAMAVTAMAAMSISSCTNEATNSQGEFDVYGRIIYRPLPLNSTAEFFLYHGGQGIENGLIVVMQDTIPLVDSSAGYYGSNLTLSIGDTVEYSVSSEFGFAEGSLVVPETVSVVTPAEFDTLVFGQGFSATWRSNSRADGYLAYLENQGGFVAALERTRLDTTAFLSGDGFMDTGMDRFWVEVLSGSFSYALAPDGKILPKGVVASAGSYRDVYIAIGR